MGPQRVLQAAAVAAALVAQVAVASAAPRTFRRRERVAVIDLGPGPGDATLRAKVAALVMSNEVTGAPATFQYMFGPWAAYLGAP